MKRITPILALLALAACESEPQRPNILIAISDDQSFAHTSLISGSGIETPALARVAAAGVEFTRGYVASPGCSPSRASFLTGLYPWQIEAAGTHGSSFPRKYISFQDRFEEAGYEVGFTGKGWAPGLWDVSGRTRNPAGPEYNDVLLEPPQGVKPWDYAGNFQLFLDQKAAGKPFSFWFGSQEPHRGYGRGNGAANGIDPDGVAVPAFLPDIPTVRNDIADYGFEIAWFDSQLGRMLDILEKAGELDNTIVIVTSDNGMPFPRAKANVYEYGVHVPLVVAWPAGFKGDRRIDDLVSLVDVTATLYEATGASVPEAYALAGKSLLADLRSGKSDVVDKTRTAVFCGRERHSSSRYANRGYPQRCIVSGDYLYIRNYAPDAWPAGDPTDASRAQYAGYYDIDGSPVKRLYMDRSDDPEIAKFLELAVAKRPAAELYDVVNDPDCLQNLAGLADFADIEARLDKRLTAQLTQDRDPRIVSANGDTLWESYGRLKGAIRDFPPPDGP